MLINEWMHSTVDVAYEQGYTIYRGLDQAHLPTNYHNSVIYAFPLRKCQNMTMIASAHCSNLSFDMKSSACESTAFVICALMPCSDVVVSLTRLVTPRN